MKKKKAKKGKPDLGELRMSKDDFERTMRGALQTPTDANPPKRKKKPKKTAKPAKPKPPRSEPRDMRHPYDFG